MLKNQPALFWTAAVLTAVCLIFTGCTAQPRDPLSYQERLQSAVVSDGMRTWEIAPIPGGFSAELLAPEPVSGITYRITDTGSVVSAGEVEIPVSESLTAAARQVIALFTLPKDCLIGTETDKASGICSVRCETDTGEITVQLDAAGTPISFETPTGTWTVERYQSGQNPQN